MATKEEILALADRKVEEVEVPEWGGGKHRIMEMSAADRDEWELQAYLERKAGPTAKNVRAGLVARCLVNEAGERLFTDAEIPLLGKKSAKALDRLYDVARRLNGLTEAEAEAIAKN